MLLILMYHQIVDPKLDTEVSINKFQQHLTYLQKNFNIIHMIISSFILFNLFYIKVSVSECH